MARNIPAGYAYESRMNVMCVSAYKMWILTTSWKNEAKISLFIAYLNTSIWA